jgi:hypothetical protein
MEKFINKVFEILSKPAKWIFVGGAFAYALWFAIRTAMSIDGQFMNVLTNIITLFVGTALCCLPPVFILIKKEELAKLFFVFLLGYWVLTAPSQYFFLAETFADAREFFPVFVSIFLLLTGVGVVGILVLSILEIILKIKFLRLLSLFIGIIVVALSYTTAILFMIEAGIMGADWSIFVEYGLITMILLPFVVGCGCIALLGVNKKAE